MSVSHGHIGEEALPLELGKGSVELVTGGISPSFRHVGSRRLAVSGGGSSSG